MNEGTRRAIAYVAGRVLSGGKVSPPVYSYDTGRHTSLSGTVGAERVSIYDHDRGCHISGRLRSLYDYGTGQHVQLKLKDGGRFDGYDYASGHHFGVKVSNRSVSVYDYETSSYHNYSV